MKILQPIIIIITAGILASIIFYLLKPIEGLPTYKYTVEYEVFYPDGKQYFKEQVKACDEPKVSSESGTNYIWLPCEGKINKTTAIIKLISVSKDN